MSTHIEIAGEYQSKFRFYFVGLTFTLLAASIQTAGLSEMRGINAIIELFGWVSLLASGLAGLSYLEFTPVVYRHIDAIENSSGENKKQLEDQLKGIQSKNSIRYALGKYGFGLGLLCIVVSRAMHGLYPAIAI
ncbi:MAG: hypothetical protein O2948_00980 [Proteobacteria bacterium]|nr:hypothetical protein [Pseudomonadota bacterium]MDA0927253.1 hypothetical protein [Pseudomonadota bacterium]